MSKFRKDKNSGGQNSKLSQHVSIPKVFITSEDDSTPPSRKEDFPINLLLQSQGYSKDEDTGSTAPLLDSGTATPLCEEPSVPLNMGTFLASSQKLKSEIISEEICLSSFDGDKDLEVSSKASDENQLGNLPDFPFVKWPWKSIRILSSFALLVGILACFCSSAVLIAHLPQRCDPSTEWWQGKVFYEIFPSSFFDSDGDGFGDLQGISLKLNYLQSYLQIDVIRLNSIFQANNYPEDNLDIVNATKVDPHLGNLQNLQSLISDLESRNMSLVIDIVISHIPEIGGASQIANKEYLVVENVLKFWLLHGVHGFYLKGLETYIHQMDLWRAVVKWKSFVETFSTTFKRRIFITSSDFLLQYSLVHPLVGANLVKNFDLVDHYVDVESPLNLEKRIKDGLYWNDGLDRPWVMWNVGTFGKMRIADFFNDSTGNGCVFTIGLLMLALSLPGSSSVLYGDEIALKNRNNSSTATMPWNELVYTNAVFNSSDSLPWLQPGDDAAVCNRSAIVLFNQFVTIRKNSLPLHINAILKYDVYDVLESRTLNYALKFLPSSKTVLLERFYPRRHRYLLILNLAKENVTHDLSSTYYGGQTLLSSSGSKKGYVKLNQLTLNAGEGLLLLLDK